MPADLFLSAISIHELEVGVLRAERKDPHAGRGIRGRGSTIMCFRPSTGAFYPSTPRWRSAARNCSVPDPRPLQDGLIAATALVHGMTVVTRNVADFEPTGVRLLNPWSA